MSSSIPVKAAAGRYLVVCHRGALKDTGNLCKGNGLTGEFYLLSSPKVWRHWGRAAERSFARAGGSRSILFEDRETAKNLKTVETICRELIRAGADRRSVIVAIGGGVVGDVAGFVAASYMRGVKLVHIPTTLVAQVDSAIGGKTGVNLPEGKNLVGAFYPPALVIADPNLLRTLPDREYRSGLYEVIKYAVIGTPGMFSELEERMGALIRRDKKALEWAILKCISAKASIVSRDEREIGLREILNFGHTFAHALEAVTRYKKFLHGEAVGWGMIAAARLAADLSLLEKSEAKQIERLIRRVGKLPPLPEISPRRLMGYMKSDKKARGGRMRFILPTRTGRVKAVDSVKGEAVVQILERWRG